MCSASLPSRSVAAPRLGVLLGACLLALASLRLAAALDSGTRVAAAGGQVHASDSLPPSGGGHPAPPATMTRTARVGAGGGAVASGHVLATAAGLAALREGGNAVDAAVATALALAVVYPEAGNLGGGGFAVVRMAAPGLLRGERGEPGDQHGQPAELRGEPGELRALDFREVAPAAARRGMYLDGGGRPRPEASTIGPLAAGVPGTPGGLFELHHALGRLPWSRVVAPAIRLARDGFVVDAHLHAVLSENAHRRLLSRFPESAAVWLPGGRPLPAGTRLRLPALAATLERYAERGPAAIVEGPVAAAIAAASRRHGGVLDTADLAAYRPAWREPLRFAAFGWQVATMPLPSAGGIVLGQSCAMLERLGWSALPRSGADRLHLLAETFRRAFADRVLLGDPATSRATPADLLDPRWIAARVAGIDRARAGDSRALAPWPGPAATAGKPGAGGGETTHLSVVDGEGNAVALTTTLNELFGCGLFVPEIGFLNNEMDDFAAAPGSTARSADGSDQLPQGEANAVAPGKRMLSSMAPTIAWRGGELLALGGRGSLRIPTHTAQVLLNVLADGDPLQAAVDRPRVHHQGLPDRLEVQPGALAPEVAAELERRGHRIVLAAPADTARVNAVRRLAGGGFEAAVDPRGAAAVGGAGVIPVAAGAGVIPAGTGTGGSR